MKEWILKLIDSQQQGYMERTFDGPSMDGPGPIVVVEKAEYMKLAERASALEDELDDARQTRLAIKLTRAEQENIRLRSMLEEVLDLQVLNDSQRQAGLYHEQECLKRAREELSRQAEQVSDGEEKTRPTPVGGVSAHVTHRNADRSSDPAHPGESTQQETPQERAESEICPCGAETSEGCSQAGCPLYLHEQSQQTNEVAEGSPTLGYPKNADAHHPSASTTRQERAGDPKPPTAEKAVAKGLNGGVPADQPAHTQQANPVGYGHTGPCQPDCTCDMAKSLRKQTEHECEDWCHCRKCGGFKAGGVPYGHSCGCEQSEPDDEAEERRIEQEYVKKRLTEEEPEPAAARWSIARHYEAAAEACKHSWPWGKERHIYERGFCEGAKWGQETKPDNGGNKS